LRERFVDLDLVQQKHRQLAERRIAGAEIVQRNGDAGIFEPVPGQQTFRHRFDQCRFGDLSGGVAARFTTYSAG
jgi:hypothetical protein